MIEHPGWCQPGRCEAPLGGAHTSMPAQITPDEQSSARAHVRLWRYPADPRTRIELALGDHDQGDGCRVDLSMNQAEALAASLVGAVRRANHERR